MTLNGPRWYVVQTQANAENKAVAHLGRLGFATYLPRYLKRRRHARRVDTVAAPLFPRYLFAEIDMGVQRWRSIGSTVGVSRLVKSGRLAGARSRRRDQRAQAPRKHVRFVQLDQHSKFKAGDHVRVVEGAFCDCLGIYDGMSDHERVEFCSIFSAARFAC